MRAPLITLAAFSILSMAPIGAKAAAAADASAPPECIFRDAHYGLGAVICVAPQFGQLCQPDGWSLPTGDKGLDKTCAGAQIPVPGVPPPQCIYHDVKYTPGAIICVAPHFGQTCTDNGAWSLATATNDFDKACANAQIPAPTYPAAPAAK
jgi:hypothetical protein